MQPNIDEIMPACQRVWMSEDSTGHRYMAQITDGANGVRWLVPLPRKEWEHLWGAIIKKRPDLLEGYGSATNLVRQLVGNFMWALLNAADDEFELPPEVVIYRNQARRLARRERVGLMRGELDVMCSHETTQEEKREAFEVLGMQEDESLNELFNLTDNQMLLGMSGRSMLHELAHQHIEGE